MIDIHETALEAGMATLAGSLERLVSKGKIDAAARDNALARIETSTDYQRLADVDIVIEAATENGELKNRILRQIEAAVRPDYCVEHVVDFDHHTRCDAGGPIALHRHALF
ncbi:Fatty acid oxidation complex subunit alpha [Paraburkholderia gardini]|uniref:Fatty acid oxidation complex subunit alpha n=1 Tax=Paraburkholderia gardini TaxID=2823469 RepID=A0ABM8UAB2_9BURK|nr:Fatty acid oxidation complex subunit alpha [Paraburkholderia gardini]